VVEEVKDSIEAVVANERKMTTFKIFLVSAVAVSWQQQQQQHAFSANSNIC
jgi:hypothetical protein